MMIGNRKILRGLSLLGMSLAMTLACRHNQESRPVPLPASNEVSGWVKTGDVRTFQAADLWKYIDGDAERYLKAGVQNVSTADYRFHDKFDATVDVYTMATVVGAKQIFESEPAEDAKPIQLGDSARQYSQSLVLRKGPFLLRITAYENSGETQQAILALGIRIEQRLTQ